VKHYTHPSAFVQLNVWLQTATEEEVQAALDAEVRGKRRNTFIKRLHQRYTILRSNRERLAMLGETK